MNTNLSAVDWKVTGYEAAWDDGQTFAGSVTFYASLAEDHGGKPWFGLCAIAGSPSLADWFATAAEAKAAVEQHIRDHTGGVA